MDKDNGQKLKYFGRKLVLKRMKEMGQFDFLVYASFGLKATR